MKNGENSRLVVGRTVNTFFINAKPLIELHGFAFRITAVLLQQNKKRSGPLDMQGVQGEGRRTGSRKLKRTYSKKGNPSINELLQHCLITKTTRCFIY